MFKNFFRSDLVDNFVWVGLGIALCVSSIKLGLGDPHNPGPGFMAFLAGACLGILGFVQFFYITLKKSMVKRAFAEKEMVIRESRVRLGLNFLILFAYILLFRPLGFLLSTFVFFSILFIIPQPKKWLILLLLSASSVAVCYFVFYVWLEVPLPRGIFHSVLGF